MPIISKFAISILRFALKFGQFFNGLNCYASLIMGFLWEKINPPTAFRFGATLALMATLLLGLAMPGGRTDVPDQETGRSS